MFKIHVKISLEIQHEIFVQMGMNLHDNQVLEPISKQKLIFSVILFMFNPFENVTIPTEVITYYELFCLVL